MTNPKISGHTANSALSLELRHSLVHFTENGEKPFGVSFAVSTEWFRIGSRFADIPGQRHGFVRHFGPNLRRLFRLGEIAVH